MRLDLNTKTEHDEIVSAVAWAPDGQLLSCSDDKHVCRWSADGEMLGKFSIGVFVTSMSWFPSTGKQAPENFAVSCTDGTFRFISRTGREEKKVTAHEGAVIIIRWSHDGSAILTCGEDGEVKVWSKSGNLRSTLASIGQSVYAACWGPDDDQILIGNGKALMIRTVQANRKNVQWDAHEGQILCADWNVANGFIVSGAEDCCYKVWDSYGRPLYSSRPMEHVVTAIAWSANGETFAVGSFNLIRLCDKTGWTHCRERVAAGSLLDIAWTSDGTQCACAGGNGAVVFAQVVDRRIEWKNTEVTLIESRKLRVQDIANESLEDLEFSRDRVVELAVGFDYLIVSTTSQCFIYNLQNLNTPIIYDIRAPPHFIHLCRRHFLTLDQITGISVVSFEGKVLSTPKFQGLRADYLTKDMVSLSPDTLVVVDSVDMKVIQIIDASSGRVMGKLSHSSAEVVCVYLNQHNLGQQERMLAFADRNRDMYVAALATPGSANIPTYKLHAHVESFAFNDETNVLVGLADGTLKYWYHPDVAFIDKDLLPHTTVPASEGSEFGRNANILAYTGNRISIRKVDGSIIFTATKPDIPLLYELTRGGRWEEATRLCRHQKNQQLGDAGFDGAQQEAAGLR